MDFSGRQRTKQELNVAPLIDVVFLLLIFFMLASTFIKPEAIDLMLEGSSTGGNAAEEMLNIEVVVDGTIRLNGLRLSMPQLETELASRIQGDQTRPVTIKAAAEVPVQTLVSIMDRVRAAGTNNLRLATPEAR
ncbi:MAG: hypothetical protein CMM34_04050 [Rhodospirillaceae bacterium]|nr:hypothetical protein [Rhodospirillaceae bacterium]